jgi:VCBS repeat-containing protein
MKIMNLKYNLIALFTICLCANSLAQDKGYKETIEMNADEKGDVTVISNIKYNAATWDYVKQRHGTDPSVLKNVFKKAFPKYQLADFDIKNDDMERISTIKFKILGSLKLDANGKWIAELDSKNPDITKISGTQFLLVNEGNAQTLKINLPGSASGAKIEKDSFGKAVLTYTAPVSGGLVGNIIKYLGFLVIAAGGFLFYRSMKSGTAILSKAGSKKIDYNKTKHIDDAVVINTVPKENSKPAEPQNNHGQY